MVHKGGLVVPYNKETDVGYRPLLETENNIKKILQKIDIAPEAVLENLQPLISAANIGLYY